MATLDEIINETNLYVDELHSYNISKIVEEMVERYSLQKDVYVFPYPGEIPVHDSMTAYDYIMMSTFDGEKFADLWNPNKNYRYNIGIFSIPMQGDQSHYMSIVVDNTTKTVYFWDSMSKPNIEDETMMSLLSSIYDNYSIKKLNVCSGCGMYQSSDQYYEQNIFCHTWSLWFIDTVLSNIKTGADINTTWTQLEKSCSTQIGNLAKVKKFAKKLALNYFDQENYKPGKAFDYVWNYETESAQDINLL